MQHRSKAWRTGLPARALSGDDRGEGDWKLMWNPTALLLFVEACLAIVFFGVMVALWRRIDFPDAALWVMVWSTRVFATIAGSAHVPRSEAGLYIGLQACSACALILILARSELRVLKQRLLRRFMLELGTSAAEPRAVAEHRGAVGTS
jgi:hypothetical protein